MRTYTLLATASNTRQEQLGYAVKAQVCSVSLLKSGIASSEDNSNTAGQFEAIPEDRSSLVELHGSTCSFFRCHLSSSEMKCEGPKSGSCQGSRYDTNALHVLLL